VHQPQVAGAPIDQGADRRAAGPADDQVVLQSPIRARCSTTAGDLAHPDRAFAEGGDPLPFQQGQVSAGAGRLGQPAGR
jgi:hypothetical protein